MSDDLIYTGATVESFITAKYSGVSLADDDVASIDVTVLNSLDVVVASGQAIKGDEGWSFVWTPTRAGMFRIRSVVHAVADSRVGVGWDRVRVVPGLSAI